VEDDVAAGGRGVGRLRVGHAAADELDAAGDRTQVRLVAGAEVVQDADRPAGGGQPLDQVGADEPGSAGNQALLHAPLLL
jgi:hypothetical protein